MENKPWLSQYPAGIPANINVDQYENMVQFLSESLKKFAELSAYECMGKTISLIDKQAR